MAKHYRYLVHIRKRDQSQSRIGEFYLTPDFTALTEDALFEAFRRGVLPHLAPRSAATVAPIFDAEIGEPFVSCVEVVVRSENQEHVCRYDRGFFMPLVTQLGSALVRTQRLTNGESFEWFVLAISEEEPPATEQLFELEELPEELRLCNGSLRSMQGRSTAHGDQTPGELPVFVHASVLEQAQALTRSTPHHETGGLLAGHMHRDNRTGEIWTEISALLPAHHTEADEIRLRFTPETWSDLYQRLVARGDDSIALGWIHSHCHIPSAKEASVSAIEKPAVPTTDGAADTEPQMLEFFSAFDVAVHRTVFSRAYAVALVATHHADDRVTFTGYGWRQGQVVPRGFRLLPGLDQEAKRS